MNQRLHDQLKKIKLLALDFDGVMTDGTVFVNENGAESVQCSRKDGEGIARLLQRGIAVHVLSKEENPVVAQRCKKLRIPCDQAIRDGEGKREILERISKTSGLEPDRVAYIGDDLHDVPPLQYAGLAITVADGHPDVIKIADYVTRASGGQHAVREVAELILSAQILDATRISTRRQND